jgi:hypothetical protein
LEDRWLSRALGFETDSREREQDIEAGDHVRRLTAAPNCQLGEEHPRENPPAYLICLVGGDPFLIPSINAKTSVVMESVLRS